jgi:prophage DNA circulation protein
MAKEGSKMSVTCQTRLESYRRIQRKLGEKQRRVYRLLKEASDVDFTMTDREIAKAMHWSINCVTPRRGELVELGLVVNVGTKFDVETKRRVVAWKAEKSQTEATP